ncbi:MAG: L-lactate dehydrogenase [Jaaginema sp. PMC 1079.18]|nr:L-lactate dehydrogenase [Jaaginema sp. PMC 1080.18]MEC4850512.1 L-lactate dehydrogenase [Jaaginema sp. PMC 1079.18]MEC4864769.1 L-lactate dehydrogenase [Jaaginema sp. PMC 1078.18]
MFEQLFANNSEAERVIPTIRPRKGVIIGAGQVGMACAYSLLIQNCFDEIVLQDIDRDKVEGEVMDLLHGVPFVESTKIKAGTVADAGKDADIVIMTAGAKQKSGETRLDLVNRNVKIFKQVIGDVAKYCPHAILLIVSNPVDIMTYVSWKLSGFEKSRVFGTGTILDTARFRYILGEKTGIAPRSIHAYIIGEHGDSEVAAWSKVNIAGTSLENYSEDSEIFNQISQEVKNAAYEIINRKGYTSYAIGLGVTEIVQAVLRNQSRILTVSSYIDNLYGIDNVCLSLPTVVNRQGASRIVKLTLSDMEEDRLRYSAKVLHEVIDSLDLE